MTERDDDLALPPGLTFPLDEGEGPARPLSQNESQAMIAAALAAWPAPPLPPGPSVAPPPSPPGPAAISPFVAGGAVAGTTSVVTLVVAAWLFGWPRTDAPPPAAPPPPPPVVVEEPAPPPTPIAAPVAEPEAPVAAEDETPSRPSESEAEDLLERASTLRGEGRFAEADGLYQRVARLYRGTNAAYVAEVSSASLRLEQLDDATAAERGFERAIRARASGALDLEARDGLARARRALGDRTGELEALHALLEGHPGTRAADRAARRIAELEAE